MKILWCHPNAWSGEYKMMAYLAKQGHQICVLQEDRKHKKTRELSPYFRETDDRIKTLWYNPAKGIEKLLTFPLDRLVRRSPYRGNVGHRMWMIKVASRRFKPDVVYCSEALGYGVPAALLKKTGLLKEALVIQSIGGDLMDEPAAEYGTRRTPVSHWLLRQAMEQSTLLKPVSPLLAGIMPLEGANPSKIRMSPSHLVAGADVLAEGYQNRVEISRSFRARYGIADDAPVIVSLSGNWMGKGTHLIAQAWATIREQVPGCIWLLAGPQPSWFIQHVKSIVDQFPGEIIQTGSLHGESVFHCLAAADLNVNPTLADGLNMVTVEAAAVGTPSLVTDKAGIADWVAKCGDGLVLPAGDVTAMAQAVGAYFQQSIEARKLMGKRFRDMSSEFGLEVLAERLVGIFNEATKS